MTDLSSQDPVRARATSGWSSAVLDALYREVFAAPSVESSGVLVGHEVTGSTPQVDALIPAERGYAAGDRALLTHASFGRVHEAMARHYRAQEIVGWYLSRPDGVYLTPQDVAAHQRFFPRESQVALVVDPRTYQGGIYALRGGQMQLVFEGPITPPTSAQRHAPRPGEPVGVPWLGYATLAVIGFVLGAALFLAAVGVGVL